MAASETLDCTMGIDWDPDIAALKLSDVEKNGLQVHRNYSRAFEKHRNKDFSDEVNGNTFDLEQLSRIHELILTEDPVAGLRCSPGSARSHATLSEFK